MANANDDNTTTSSDDSWFVPSFAEAFKGTRLQQGHDAEFRAVVSGKPQPKVSWAKNGQALPPSMTPDKYIPSYDPQTGQVSLRIKNLGPGDEGTYACTVSNAYGSTTATLSVNPEAQNKKTGKRCLSPGCSRATLQRQHVLKQMQNTSSPGNMDLRHSPNHILQAQGL